MNALTPRKQMLVLAVIASIASIAGYLAFWIPWRLAGSHNNLIDGMQPISLLFLLLIGFVCALVVPHRFWIAGLASMTLFPIITVIEIIRDPTSHNLIPFELIAYAFLTVPALLGGGFGRMIRNLLSRRRG